MLKFLSYYCEGVIASPWGQLPGVKSIVKQCIILSMQWWCCHIVPIFCQINPPPLVLAKNMVLSNIVPSCLDLERLQDGLLDGESPLIWWIHQVSNKNVFHQCVHPLKADNWVFVLQILTFVSILISVLDQWAHVAKAGSSHLGDRLAGAEANPLFHSPSYLPQMLFFTRLCICHNYYFSPASISATNLLRFWQ